MPEIICQIGKAAGVKVRATTFTTSAATGSCWAGREGKAVCLFADAAQVAHNLVRDLPYTGISVGWQWNPQPTPCKNNVVERNHVYDVMKALCDGGCIYTLGFQPGTVIRGNHLHDVKRSLFARGRAAGARRAFATGPIPSGRGRRART